MILVLMGPLPLRRPQRCSGAKKREATVGKASAALDALLAHFGSAKSPWLRRGDECHISTVSCSLSIGFAHGFSPRKGRGNAQGRAARSVPAL